MEKSDGSMPFPRVSDAGEERERGKEKREGEGGKKEENGSNGSQPRFSLFANASWPFF